MPPRESQLAVIMVLGLVAVVIGGLICAALIISSGRTEPPWLMALVVSAATAIITLPARLPGLAITDPDRDP